MACEPEQQLIADLMQQLSDINAALQLAVSRADTWMQQMNAAQAALAACQMANQNPPNPPGT